jgi:outer membrane protein OmpA-like peptidoglycan-associated protein
MSKKALYLLGIAITIILGTFLYLKFCCNCSMKTPTAAAEKTPVASSDTTSVRFILNGSGINFRTGDNLKFLKNSASLLTPISDSVGIGIENLKRFLAANPKQKVIITGFAISDETNNSTFENLGLARANEVKNYFISKGLAANKFDTKGEIIKNWKMIADTLIGPVEYKFPALDTITAVNNEWNTLKEKINADPLILHFNTNKASDNLSTVEKQKVTDILEYLKNVKDATVLIVGHSDNVGNRDANLVLGQKRAEFSKDYLVKNGIEAERITTESKGPDEPIGENTTTEGKANNRRTVITIK